MVEKRKLYLFTVLIYSVTILSFLIVFLWGRPNFNTVTTICKNLEAKNLLLNGSCISEGGEKWILPPGLIALQWTLPQSISFAFSYPISWYLTWFFLLISFVLTIFYLGRLTIVDLYFGKTYSKALESINIKKKLINITVRKYFLFPLFFSLPLYVLGIDYGRWFTPISLNFIIVILSKELMEQERKLIGNEKNDDFDLHRSNEQLRLKELPYVNLLILSILVFIKLPVYIVKDFNFIKEPFLTIIQKLLF
jgi:hypothetical protein